MLLIKFNSLQKRIADEITTVLPGLIGQNEELLSKVKDLNNKLIAITRISSEITEYEKSNN